MQTIKVEINGHISYRKPNKKEGGYKPEKSYSNKWFFANRKIDACEQVYQIGQEYLNKVQNPKTAPHRRNQHPISLVKYLYFDWLAGGRLMDGILKSPSIEVLYLHNPEETYVKITKLNQKHKGPDGKTEEIVAVVPICHPSEWLMLNFLLDNKETGEGNELFRWERWGKLNKSKISRYFKRNFKTNLIDPSSKKEHSDSNITPHLLRHQRAYDLIIDHHLKNESIMKIMGWKDERMIYYYADIAQKLGEQKQIDIMRGKGIAQSFQPIVT